MRMSDSEGGVEDTGGGKDTDLQEPETPLRLEDARGRTSSEGAEVEEQVRSLGRTYQQSEGGPVKTCIEDGGLCPSAKEQVFTGPQVVLAGSSF